MKLQTSKAFELRCLNCRELDHAETMYQALEKATRHIGLDSDHSSPNHRGGLGHGSHRMVITECTLVQKQDITAEERRRGE